MNTVYAWTIDQARRAAFMHRAERAIFNAVPMREEQRRDHHECRAAFYRLHAMRLAREAARIRREALALT